MNDVRAPGGEEVADEPDGAPASPPEPAAPLAAALGADVGTAPDAETDAAPDDRVDIDRDALDALDPARARDAPSEAPAEPGAEARAAAVSRARRLLATEPWASATERVTLWLVSPPRELDAAPDSPVEAWLAIDREAAQTLGDAARTQIEGGAASQALPAAGAGAAGQPPGSAALFTVEALEALLAGEGRRALEARWSLHHAQPLADRLGRHERLVARASQLSEGALERALRGAFLAAAGALPALGRLGEPADDAEGHDAHGGRARRRDALPAAGEAVAGLTRIACLLDEGRHPPLAWLLPAAHDTRLGRRLASWLDDLARSLAGEAAAARRVIAGRDAVLEQTRVLVAHRVGERPWLRDPASFALRPPRS